MQLSDPDGLIIAENDDAENPEYGSLDSAIVDLLLTKDGIFTISVSQIGERYGTYALILKTEDSSLDTTLTTHQLNYGSSVTGTTDNGEKEEWYFQGANEELIFIGVKSNSFDTYVEIYDSSGALLASDDDGAGGTNSLLEYTLPYDDLYTITVSGIGGKGGPYDLSLTTTLPQSQSVSDTTSSSGNNIGASSMEADNPCPGFMFPRLTIGAKGRVSTEDPAPSSIRAAPESPDIVAQVPAGDEFFVLEGPRCLSGSGIAWWKIEYKGIVGWSAEGKDGEYWLEPLIYKE